MVESFFREFVDKVTDSFRVEEMIWFVYGLAQRTDELVKDEVSETLNLSLKYVECDSIEEEGRFFESIKNKSVVWK